MNKKTMSTINALSVMASKFVMFGSEDSLDSFILTSANMFGAAPGYYSNIISKGYSLCLSSSYVVSKKKNSYIDSDKNREILNFVCMKALSDVNYTNLLLVWFLLRFTDNLYCLSRVKTLIIDSISMDTDIDSGMLYVYPSVYRYVLVEYTKSALAGESFNDLRSVDFIYLIEGTFSGGNCDAFSGKHTGDTSFAAIIIKALSALKGCYICDKERLYLNNCSKRYYNEVIFLACVIPGLLTKDVFYKRLLDCNYYVYSAAVRNPLVEYVLNIDLWDGILE